eukprot:909479-Amphidinium_carterae.1
MSQTIRMVFDVSLLTTPTNIDRIQQEGTMPVAFYVNVYEPQGLNICPGDCSLLCGSTTVKRGTH